MQTRKILAKLVVLCLGCFLSSASIIEQDSSFLTADKSLSLPASDNCLQAGIDQIFHYTSQRKEYRSTAAELVDNNEAIEKHHSKHRHNWHNAKKVLILGGAEALSM